jgi:cytochrome d ubiquinol oxidase subunit II
MMKTGGRIAARAKYHAEVALLVTLGFIVAVSVWTPIAYERIAERWFHGDQLAWLWPVPFLTAAAAFIAWGGARKGSGVQAFLSAMALFLLCFLGLGISTFPYLVPPSVTIWQAAAVPQSQIFSLIGALLFLPLILAYTAFVYWTFRGKVAEGGGYH